MAPCSTCKQNHLHRDCPKWVAEQAAKEATNATAQAKKETAPLEARVFECDGLDETSLAALLGTVFPDISVHKGGPTGPVPSPEQEAERAGPEVDLNDFLITYSRVLPVPDDLPNSGDLSQNCCSPSST
jgi:hypothetical protein